MKFITGQARSVLGANWCQSVPRLTAVARRYATDSTVPDPAQAAPTDSSSVVQANPPSLLSKLEGDSSLATPAPTDKKTVRRLRKFNPRGRAMARRYELPGSRYQYHPPKYDRGPMHPVQPNRSSDPTARQFVPGPFNLPRLKQTYNDAMAHDILTLAYTHIIPGEKPDFIPQVYEDRVATWDDSSPYHAGRGHKGPKETSRLQLLEKPISFFNVPRLESIAIQCFIRQAEKDRDYWVAGWTALKNITGKSPWNIRIKHPSSGFTIQRNHLAGVMTTIRGDTAYEFLDKLVHFVLPRIKDYPGLYNSTGDRNGGIQLGLTPREVAQFPEILVNADMYPTKMIPGMRISINTSAQSNRHAKLLMQAMGLPFTRERMLKRNRDIDF